MYIFYFWDLPIFLAPELLDVFRCSQLGSLLGAGIRLTSINSNVAGLEQTCSNWAISLLVCHNCGNSVRNNRKLPSGICDQAGMGSWSSVKAFFNPSRWAVFKTKFSYGYGGFFSPRALILKESGQYLLIKDSAQSHGITYILYDVVLTPSELQTLILSAVGQLFDLIGRVRIHANLIDQKEDHLLTFWGMSGAGKSTRAFEASKNGLKVLTDECYWVSDSEKKIWPLNLPIKLKRNLSKNTKRVEQVPRTVFVSLGQSLYSPIEINEKTLTGFCLPYLGTSPIFKILNYFPRLAFCIQVSLGLGHPQMREIVLRWPYLCFLPKIFFIRLRTALWFHKFNLFNKT